ncbi:Methyltransferase domain-containing protein [Belliella buryatensis]|uniref:Methyltransferase domain-containing protein n=1 Tax=Belliella buryatensis TaxID=1500549 RepID=A0A239D3A4_9BACT|nr:class I SAM-dependent methyltransferase [Belliella buryatensis]SNS26622.1 Methyltransferase domain-containing protein [Belliella buryatensis]
MEVNKEKVEGFYDQFADQQIKTGVNSRHLSIINKLISSGLKSNHQVLEVGCGIGTVSQLIAKQVNAGEVLAVDISPKSIEKAKELWKAKSNLSFEVSDMSDFEKKGKTFDYFVFPDVLEHIPVEQHSTLFANISKHAHENSVVFVHIPSPRFLEWMIKNEPEKLQVIDQPLDTSKLIGVLQQFGFYLEEMKTYSVYYEEKDYQFFIFRRNSAIEKTTMRKKIDVFLERLAFKLKIK